MPWAVEGLAGLVRIPSIATDGRRRARAVDRKGGGGPTSSSSPAGVLLGPTPVRMIRASLRELLEGTPGAEVVEPIDAAVQELRRRHGLLTTAGQSAMPTGSGASWPPTSAAPGRCYGSTSSCTRILRGTPRH